MVERPFCQHQDACQAKTPGRHCLACVSFDPAVAQRRREAQRRVLSDPEALARRQEGCRKATATPGRVAASIAACAKPEAKAAHQIACKAGVQKRLADPVKREALRQIGLTVGKANLDASRDPASYQRRGATIRAIRLSWCPPEHWELNAKLKANGYRLPERKRMILETVEGSAEHAKRTVANAAVAGQLKHEREKAQRY